MTTPTRDYYIQLDTMYKITGEPISLVQGDNGGNVFHFNLTENDEPIDLTGASVTITLKKSDGNKVVNYCLVTDALNGLCDYVVDIQAMSYIGPVTYTVEIYSNNSRVTTNQAKFKVVAELDDGSGVISNSNYNILSDLIEEVNTIENNTINNETLRQQNETTRQSNEVVRQSNETSRITTFNTNETSRQNTFTASETNRSNIFNANENTRTVNEANRVIAFNNNENARQTTFTASENTRQGIFNSNETQREEAYQDIREYLNSATAVGRLPYHLDGGLITTQADLTDLGTSGIHLDGGWINA